LQRRGGREETLEIKNNRFTLDIILTCRRKKNPMYQKGGDSKKEGPGVRRPKGLLLGWQSKSPTKEKKEKVREKKHPKKETPN